MQKGHDVTDFSVGEIERGHAFVWTALANHGADPIAVLVVTDHGTQDQIRAIRCPGCIGAMAEGTCLDELLAAAVHSVSTIPRAGPVSARRARSDGSIMG